MIVVRSFSFFRRSKNYKASTLKRSRSLRQALEQLEVRTLMASDVMPGWTPANRPIGISSIELVASAAFTEQSWQTVLDNYAVSFGANESSAPTFRVSDVRYDLSGTAAHIYLQQTLAGIDIVNAQANLTVMNSGDVVYGSTSFVDPVLTSSFAIRFAPVSPQLALASLANAYGWPAPDLTQPVDEGVAGEQSSFLAPEIATAPVLYESVYVATASGTVESAWRLNVQAKTDGLWLDATVSTLGNQIMYVASWGAHARYDALELPLENPNQGTTVSIVDPQSAIESPFGWHDTNGVIGAEYTTTRGNNTWAYRDTNSDNIPDAQSSPGGGAGLVFNSAFDPALDAVANADASTVNLFYVTNVLHDVFASKGFDAAAGNFQANNYGAGGLANDPLLAEDLDGAHLNNATMTTPPDGTSPRLQLGIWNSATPSRSASMDNGIVAHEFAHGVTSRLTGGPANASALATLQSNGMGEGWSDFFALLFTQKSTDTATSGRSLGTYVLGQDANGKGIRTQKYSYDMSVNTHTYSSIVGISSVHLIGEVWASVLWDLNWALISGNSLDPAIKTAGLGFNADLTSDQGGNNLAMKLVVQALKMQPTNPTFLQARDAILAADKLLTGGKYQDTIWYVFARRGMGVNAVDQGGSNATILQAAFDQPLADTLTFTRSGVIGSTLSTADGVLKPISAANGTTAIDFVGDQGSPISFRLTPTASNARLSATIRDSSGAVVRNIPLSTTPGASLNIQAFRPAADGLYTLTVRSSIPSNIQISAARNAVFESSIGDTTQTSPLNIDAAIQNLSGTGIESVLGDTSSPVTITKVVDPTRFIDISNNGTKLNLEDEGHATITTTIGNGLIPAGAVTVSNNGGILAGAARTLSFQNTTIEDLPSSTLGLFPFWDDIDADTGAVFWKEQVVNGVPTLIIQWDQRTIFPNAGSGTFQLQLYGTGSVLARFAYKDVLFGEDNFDGGAGATIGYAGQSLRGQFSFNTKSIADGDTLVIGPGPEQDFYTFTAVAGQKVDVVLDANSGADLTGTTVQLLDSSDAVLATASARPLGGTVSPTNFDQAIFNFAIPATGTYKVQLSSRTVYGYKLTVLKNVGIEQENRAGALAPLRNLSVPGALIGFLNSSDVTDVSSVSLTQGERVRLIASRPGIAPGITPVQSLQVRLSIIGSTGKVVATTDKLNAQGLVVLDYTPTTTGVHRIEVRRTAGLGVYHLRTVSLTPVNNLVGGEVDPLLADWIDESVPPVESDDLTLLPQWQNWLQPMDVSNDDEITGLDALLIINELNSHQVSNSSGQLQNTAAIDAFYDASGDGMVTALDALLVINAINSPLTDPLVEEVS